MRPGGLLMPTLTLFENGFDQRKVSVQILGPFDLEKGLFVLLIFSETMKFN